MDIENFFYMNNSNSNSNNLSEIYKLSKLLHPKIILSTATPMINSPYDMVKLLELSGIKIDEPTV